MTFSHDSLSQQSWWQCQLSLTLSVIIYSPSCHSKLARLSSLEHFWGKIYIYIFKHLYLCVFQRKSYRFEMTWVWFIFGWTIPLITGWINVLLFFKCFKGIRTLDISSVHMRVITQKQHLKSKTKALISSYIPSGEIALFIIAGSQAINDGK